MMHIGSTAMVFWLLAAGCWHGGRPVVPQSAESAVADSPIYWNEGQVKPEWPVAEGGNLQVRFWSESAPGCSGIRTREQMVPAPDRRTAYKSMTIIKSGAVVQAGLRRHHQVSEVDLASGQYCVTVEQHVCLITVVVPEKRADPILVQAPDPLKQAELPSITVDSAAGVVRIDISEPVSARVARCA